VAQAVLDLQGQLRRGQAEFGHGEYGIVAKSAAPQGLLGDPPPPAPFESLEGAVGPAQNEDAAECRPPFVRGNAPQRFEELSIVLRIGGVRTGVPGGKDARVSVQGVHLDPRIVGKRRLSGESANDPGLFQGIVQKRETVLPDFRNIIIIV